MNYSDFKEFIGSVSFGFFYIFFFIIGYKLIYDQNYDNLLRFLLFLTSFNVFFFLPQKYLFTMFISMINLCILFYIIFYIGKISWAVLLGLIFGTLCAWSKTN